LQVHAATGRRTEYWSLWPLSDYAGHNVFRCFFCNYGKVIELLHVVALENAQKTVKASAYLEFKIPYFSRINLKLKTDLVHIRALIPLFQIETDECTYIIQTPPY
jgi:hypothetical protein